MPRTTPHRRWTALVMALLCMGCAVAEPAVDAPATNAPSSHHTKDGYKNNYLEGAISGGSFFRWQWERITQGLPKPPANNYQFPVDSPDLPWLAQNRSVTSATWIGHATVLMQVNGVNVLTDPIFSERASPVSFYGPKRKVRVPLTIAQLPHVDVVVISHNHYDHLDRPSVQQLNKQAGGPPLFLVPLGLKAWMADAGITNVRELDWWQHVSVPGLELHLVPVQHWSARTLSDRFDTLWGGWMVRTDTTAAKPFSFFFAGDTGYSADFTDIAKRFPKTDLALLPIGAYAPRWFMAPQHVNPTEAVRIHRDLHATRSIGIHWGTFELTDEPLDEPPQALMRALQDADLPTSQFGVLHHGETAKF